VRFVANRFQSASGTIARDRGDAIVIRCWESRRRNTRGPPNQQGRVPAHFAFRWSVAQRQVRRPSAARIPRPRFRVFARSLEICDDVRRRPLRSSTGCRSRSSPDSRDAANRVTTERVGRDAAEQSRSSRQREESLSVHDDTGRRLCKHGEQPFLERAIASTAAVRHSQQIARSGRILRAPLSFHGANM